MADTTDAKVEQDSKAIANVRVLKDGRWFWSPRIGKPLKDLPEGDHELVLASDIAALQAEVAQLRARTLELERQRDDYLNREWAATKAKQAAEAEAARLREDAAAWRQFCEAVGAQQAVDASAKFGDALGIVRDAARYRFVRDPVFKPGEPQPDAWIEFRGNEHIESEWLTGDMADAAIDAALKESAHGQG